MISLLSLGMQQLQSAFQDATEQALSNSPRGLTDEQTQLLADAIIAALLHLYGSQAIQANTRVGLSQIPDPQDTLESFARTQAGFIQKRINQTLADSTTVTAARSEIQSDNEVHERFIQSWAKHEATHDVYEAKRSDGTPASDSVLWQWEQFSQWQDECAEAMALGPAPLSAILAVSGGWPPRHPFCRCLLTPTSTPTKHAWHYQTVVR